MQVSFFVKCIPTKEKTKYWIRRRSGSLWSSDWMDLRQWHRHRQRIKNLCEGRTFWGNKKRSRDPISCIGEQLDFRPHYPLPVADADLSGVASQTHTYACTYIYVCVYKVGTVGTINIGGVLSVAQSLFVRWFEFLLA